MRPVWFPDWRGQAAIVIASGPSAPDIDFAMARGRARVLAIKTSIDLCPWADVLHAADYLWWERHDGCSAFAGLKTTLNRRACEQGWGLRFLRSGFGMKGMEFDDLGRVGWGGNSGFGAVNLAAQFGAAKILLAGFDMRIDRGVRWHADHGVGSANPDAPTAEEWRRRLDDVAPSLASRGVRVINCSARSALTAYEKMPFAAALAA